MWGCSSYDSTVVLSLILLLLSSLPLACRFVHKKYFGRFCQQSQQCWWWCCNVIIIVYVYGTQCYVLFTASAHVQVCINKLYVGWNYFSSWCFFASMLYLFVACCCCYYYSTLLVEYSNLSSSSSFASLGVCVFLSFFSSSLFLYF